MFLQTLLKLNTRNLEFSLSRLRAQIYKYINCTYSSKFYILFTNKTLLKVPCRFPQQTFRSNKSVNNVLFTNFSPLKIPLFKHSFWEFMLFNSEVLSKALGVILIQQYFKQSYERKNLKYTFTEYQKRGLRIQYVKNSCFYYCITIQLCL